MPQFRIHSCAKLDVLEIVDYLTSRSPQAALRFVDAVDATYARIRSMPRAGVRLLRHDRAEQDWRYMHIAGFKRYIIYYRVDSDVTRVIRVAHGSRDIESILRATPP